VLVGGDLDPADPATATAARVRPSRTARSENSKIDHLPTIAAWPSVRHEREDVTKTFAEVRGGLMTESEFPAPHDGFVVTHFLVVSDQDRSREFYQSVFGATVVLERDPVILKIANSWLILNVGGGPTDDKPTVTLAPPADPGRTSAFLNLRVADIAAVYAEWSAKGAEFLTEPKDHAHEIRAYIRDPDGHLIEVGQAKAPPGAP